MPRARGLEDEMTDVLFALLLVALFAVTAGAVAVCERLLGADDAIPAPSLEREEPEGVAA